MLNKRKIISNLIDFLIIILINTFFISAFLKLLSLFISKMDILFYIIITLDIILITLNLSKMLRMKKTLGKKIALILVRDGNKKITWKEVIILIIILLIISFI